MLIAIPDVLTADQVDPRTPAPRRGELDRRQGHRRPAVGWAKDNLQLAEGDPVARELGDLILGALQRSALFISAALPLRIFPPLFSRATRAASRSATTSTTRSARSPARRTASAPTCRRRCSSPIRTNTTAASW
jgi:predicted 2-oxoglutarate/Fe(II)-dependent dioxygenase YbiX